MASIIKYKLLLALSMMLAFNACKNSSGTSDDTSLSKTGQKIVETGELAAIDSRAFILQQFGGYWFQMKIIGLLKHGTIVKAGDSIIQLDPTDIKKMIIERESQLETQLATLAKLKVNLDNKHQDLNSKLSSENASFALSKLELQSASFESTRNRKIKELEFEQAKINLARVKRQIELNKTIDACDMKILQTQVKQLKYEIKNAYDILPVLTVRTPISGIFQVGTNRRNRETLKIGNEVYPGQNMGNVPDLTWMKVNSTISENDFMKLAIGQKVVVRLDALPKVNFDGEISYISKLCRLKDDKNRKKVFDVDVKILKSDERLKPGMTVSCEFIQKK